MVRRANRVLKPKEKEPTMYLDTTRRRSQTHNIEEYELNTYLTLQGGIQVGRVFLGSVVVPMDIGQWCYMVLAKKNSHED